MGLLSMALNMAGKASAIPLFHQSNDSFSTLCDREKSCLKCLNLQIMKFDGLVSENMWGTLCLKTNAISSITFLILQQI